MCVRSFECRMVGRRIGDLMCAGLSTGEACLLSIVIDSCRVVWDQDTVAVSRGMA
jgi:uncharacterized protein YoaH (UPF0181 family)